MFENKCIDPGDQWGFNEPANGICDNAVKVLSHKISYALLAVTKYRTSVPEILNF